MLKNQENFIKQKKKKTILHVFARILKVNNL